MDLQGFLANLEVNRAKEALKPNPEQEFVKTQFNGVISALDDTQKAMAKFLESYSPNIDFPTSISTPDAQDVVKAIKALEKSLKPVGVDNTDIVKAIQALDLNTTYSPEIKVAPTPVTVKAPQIKVDAPDLKPLEKAIKANKPEKADNSKLEKLLNDNLAATKKVSDTLLKLKFPVTNVPTDPLIKFTPADIDDAGAVQYFGYIAVGGEWYIRKFDTSASPKTIRFCFGSGGASVYNTAFTNRASQTYALWSQ